MNSPEHLPSETHKPITGYLWGALVGAHLSLPFADSRHCASRHDYRRVHRGALGYCSPHADRLVCPVCDAAAAGLQGKIMTASQPAESGQL